MRRRLSDEEQDQRVAYLIGVGLEQGVVFWPHLDFDGLSPIRRKIVMYAMLSWLQANRCGICSGGDIPLVLDHEPNGYVRGLLCRKCNNDEGRAFDWSAEHAAMFCQVAPPQPSRVVAMAPPQLRLSRPA